MDTYQDGQAWQYRIDDAADWLNLFTQFVYQQPAWNEDTQYRLHPHNDLIQAHRNGAKIQAYICGDWVEEPNPDWCTMILNIESNQQLKLCMNGCTDQKAVPNGQLEKYY
jgi:hypothetical protein